MRKIRKRKKTKGTWAVHNGKVSYVCSQCKIEEDVPVDVVNLFDIVDPGDPSVPPRFSCEKCGGIMSPV